MDNGSLVAAISYLRGLTLLEARSETERLEMSGRNNGHSGGIEAINARLYKGELGNMDFTKPLNLLSLNVWVYPDVVKVEGLIPLVIPMGGITVDIPRLNDAKGYSKNNRLPPGARPWPARHRALTAAFQPVVPVATETGLAPAPPIHPGPTSLVLWEAAGGGPPIPSSQTQLPRGPLQPWRPG